MKKEEVRELIKTERARISKESIESLSSKIADSLIANFVLDRKTIHCFLPIERMKEVNTFILIEKIREEFPDTKVVVPRINNEKEMEQVIFETYTPLVENAFHIQEPASGVLADPTEIDIVIVPLLAVDEYGNRVGYGKGYYDRFLAKTKHDCLKIGLSFFAPLENLEDVMEHDVAVDYCVTPYAIHCFKK